MYLRVLLIVSMLAVSHQVELNYCDILHNSMLFYEAQRSGQLPSTNRVTWRGDSALGDCTDGCTVVDGLGDLEGGYYDAGDGVKFGLPGAWTLTTLSWGLLEFRGAVDACGELDYYKDTIKWGLDWFIKAHPSPNVLWGQVGNGEADHAWWGPPELMTMARPAYKIDAQHPGTELAMEAAAAFAAGSLVFQDDDPTYSATLLQHATDLYNFGNTYRGTYTNSITDAGAFYASYSGYYDEIAWASLWLYKATGTIDYLNTAKSVYTTNGMVDAARTNSFDWDSKAPGVVVLMAKVTGEAAYKNDAVSWLSWWRPGGGVPYTPGGLAYIRQWGPCRYSANSAFLALVNANTGDNAWAETQINYMLGVNPNLQSFVVGIGSKHPINPHHRAAHHSLTNDINNPVNNKYIIYGALVGGPDNNDVYVDDRTDYTKNEVALDYNAGFSGALAALAAIYPDGNPNANIPAFTTAGAGTGSDTSAASSTTTGGSNSCGAGTAPSGGCSGVGITMNSGNGQYWFAINSPITGVSATITSVQFRDANTFSSWTTMVVESWGYSYGTTGGATLTTPISLMITLCDGSVLIVTNVITSLSGSPVYCGTANTVSTSAASTTSTSAASTTTTSAASTTTTSAVSATTTANKGTTTTAATTSSTTTTAGSSSSIGSTSSVASSSVPSASSSTSPSAPTSASSSVSTSASSPATSAASSAPTSVSTSHSSTAPSTTDPQLQISIGVYTHVKGVFIYLLLGVAVFLL